MAESVGSAARARAIQLFDAGRFDLAERELRAQLEVQPDDPWAHALLALSLAALGRAREAVPEADLAVSLGPDDAHSHYAQARVRSRVYDADGATEAALEAVRLRPDWHRAYIALAEAHTTGHRWGKVREAASTGLALAPQDTDLLNLLSLAGPKRDRGRVSASFAETLRIDPTDVDALSMMALAALRSGDVETASERYREALRLDPTLVSARIGMVETLKSRRPLFVRYFRAKWWLIDQGRRPFVLAAIIALGILPVVSLLLTAVLPTLSVPLTLSAVAVVVGAWLLFAIDPIYELIVGRHPVDRASLEVDHRFRAAIFAILVSIGGISAGIAILTDFAALPVAIAVVSLCLVSPMSSWVDGPGRTAGGMLLLAAAAMLLLGVIAAVAAILGAAEVASALTLGCVGLAWLTLVSTILHRQLRFDE